jgi:hypothetical protein
MLISSQIPGLPPSSCNLPCLAASVFCWFQGKKEYSEKQEELRVSSS